MANEKILITGGSGLIGARLSELLLEKGYKVSWLSRTKGKNGTIEIFKWDYKNNEIEEEAVRNSDYIIHLAGAGVGEKRWTNNYKNEILESRTMTTNLLFRTVSKVNPKLKAFISGSAVGIYGADRGTELLAENSRKGDDFLADVVIEWEKSVEKFKELKIRTVLIRTGIALSEKGGALDRMTKPIKLNAGAALGSGKQYVPWIHIDDLCAIFIKALENDKLNGPYNAVAPNPVSNAALTKEIGKINGKNIMLPNVPSWVLKIALGEFAESVLGSANVSSEKIRSTGFRFKFNEIGEALIDLVKKQGS